ncbi:MAG: HAMP domain-containing histidine kinase [Clostridiales bacterium]|nr:HAMP domain-containing histidine kinase [Clostridiales bacterium]
MSKKNNDKKELSKSLTHSVAIAILMIFITAQLIQVVVKYNILNSNLEDKMENVNGVLISSLTEAVWDYDEEQIHSIGDSVFINTEIYSLIVRDAITGVVYDKVLESDEKNLNLITSDINRNGSVIGSLELKYTKKALYRNLMVDSMQELFIVLVLILGIFFVMTRNINKTIKPIKELEFYANNIIKDFDMKLESDIMEIDSLITSFMSMKEQVIMYTQELKILNDSLENKVEMRTNELMEKNTELEGVISKLHSAEKEILKISNIKLTTKLVSGVAHEIGTPLGNAVTISSYIDQMVSLRESSDGIKYEIPIGEYESLDISQKKLSESLRQVVKLVNQFKALNVSLEHKVERDVNMNEFLEKSMNIIVFDYDESIKYDIECDKSIDFLIRPTLMLEVLKQLVDNSVIHGYQEKEDIKLNISCKKIMDGIVIVFKDFGKGMTEEFCEVAFMPFSKVERLSPGTGLGLAIVENLVVNGLGGSISCDASSETGTAFIIELNTKSKSE